MKVSESDKQMAEHVKKIVLRLGKLQAKIIFKELQVEDTLVAPLISASTQNFFFRNLEKMLVLMDKNMRIEYINFLKNQHEKAFNKLIQENLDA